MLLAAAFPPLSTLREMHGKVGIKSSDSMEQAEESLFHLAPLFSLPPIPSPSLFSKTIPLFLWLHLFKDELSETLSTNAVSFSATSIMSA